MTSLKIEIVQQRPFSSPREEAFLSLLRTADCLQRAFHLQTRGWGLTATQYNVLRILRGAQPDGLTCAAIGQRMITAVPDITRLLARLKALDYVRQQRDTTDRRVVWTQITPAGLDLLGQMDPVIEAIPAALLGHLEDGAVAQLIQLLEAARKPHLPAPAEVAPRSSPING
jgi:DNA-binding MarR family transcriptional regulator